MKRLAIFLLPRCFDQVRDYFRYNRSAEQRHHSNASVSQPFHGGPNETYRSYLLCDRNVICLSTRTGRAKPNRRARKEGETSIRRDDTKRERERWWRQGTTTMGTLSPRLFPLLRHITSRLDETRPSHVTLNWSIIWQSSCPNRRRSQSKEAPRLSVPDNRGVFLDKGHHVIQKYSTLLLGLTKRRRGLGRMKS